MGFAVIHGCSRLPIYKTWSGIKYRCENPNSERYPYYGGRGIKVCKRWSKSFQNFLADMGPKPDHGFTLERKNNDGNYTPNNCIWASWETQARNRRPRGGLFCKYGHLLSGDNLRLCKIPGIHYGMRICVACKRRRDNAYYWKMKGDT